MTYVSNIFHHDKLKNYNINIKTKYIVGNNILERNSNGSHNDDIINGIIDKKEYYVNNTLKHTEKDFDSRMEYSYISKKLENQDYTCPNCGMVSKLKDIDECCPYCHTYYNIDYLDKDLGSKYYYDQIIHSNTYRLITAVIDLLISLLLSYIYIKTTSRTFNNIDVIKIIAYGITLSLILYYLFYTIDAYIVLGPIKRYKKRINDKQLAFWNKLNINKTVFFNNFNYELSKYYYASKDIIDYDILDFLNFEDFIQNNKLCIKVTIRVRIIYYENNKIITKTTNQSYVLQHNDNGITKLNNGVNIITCHNCGASIDVNKSECDYCHTKIKYLQEWVLSTQS